MLRPVTDGSPSNVVARCKFSGGCEAVGTAALSMRAQIAALADIGDLAFGEGAAAPVFYAGVIEVLRDDRIVTAGGGRHPTLIRSYLVGCSWRVLRIDFVCRAFHIRRMAHLERALMPSVAISQRAEFPRRRQSFPTPRTWLRGWPDLQANPTFVFANVRTRARCEVMMSARELIVGVRALTDFLNAKGLRITYATAGKLMAPSVGRGPEIVGYVGRLPCFNPDKVLAWYREHMITPTKAVLVTKRTQERSGASRRKRAATATQGARGIMTPTTLAIHVILHIEAFALAFMVVWNAYPWGVA